MNWHDYFTYEPGTGNLIWRSRSIDLFKSDRDWRIWNTRYSGKVAGCFDGGGYVKLCLFGKRYQAQQVVWEMHNDPLADGMTIDHFDLCRSNNRIGNLREATMSQNSSNAPRRNDNTSGFKGVSKSTASSGWYVRIQVAGVRKWIGVFPTKEEAHAAYCVAAKEQHGEFARTL